MIDASIVTLLQNYGLPVLFVVVFLESFGLPLPGETALIFFAVAASQGHYSITAVVILAALAAILGDNAGYWLIGKRGGIALLERWRWLRERTVAGRDRLVRLMQRYGAWLVFFGRFVAFLRYTVAWAAGLAGMPWWKFFAANALGGVLWAGLVGFGSYYGGKAAVASIERYSEYAVLTLLALGIGAVVVYRIVMRRLAKRLSK